MWSICRTAPLSCCARAVLRSRWRILRIVLFTRSDRGLVALSGRYMEAFFENGLTRRSYRFRVFNPLREKYRCARLRCRIDQD